MMKSKVISGFPGVGKSTLFNTGLNCSDSDSSKFDKSLFPGNYISHIQKLLNSGELDFVFVSSHEIVRDALISAEIPFTLVYPCLEAKRTSSSVISLADRQKVLSIFWTITSNRGFGSAKRLITR